MEMSWYRHSKRKGEGVQMVSVRTMQSVGITFGAINPNGAFSIATSGDWVVIVALILGDLLWLTAQFSSRPHRAEIESAGN